MAIPLLTVDKLTGQSVAQYPDGRVSPMGTSQGFMSQEGWVGGDTNPGTGWGGIPTPETTLASGRGSGDAGPTGAPGSLGGQSGANTFYDENGWGNGPLGSAGGLGDRPHGVERPRTTQDSLRGLSGSGPRSGGLAVDGAPGSLSSGYGSDVGSAHGSGGGRGGPSLESVGSRLADARSRLQSGKAEAASRLAAAGIGGGGGGGYASGYSSSGYGSTKTPKPDRPDRIHTKWGKLDESQAAGLTARDSMMIPRVFKGLTPASPLYTTISNLPIGAMGQIMGKGTVKSTAKKIGQFTQAAGTTGNIPSPEALLNNLTRGKGVEDMFQGVKAKKGDYESQIAPGYVYGQEPLSAAEAASQYGTLLDAALSGLPRQTAAKYSAQPGSGGWGDYLIDKWGSKAMKRPAGKGKPIYRSVGRRLFR